MHRQYMLGSLVDHTRNYRNLCPDANPVTAERTRRRDDHRLDPGRGLAGGAQAGSSRSAPLQRRALRLRWPRRSWSSRPDGGRSRSRH